MMLTPILKTGPSFRDTNAPNQHVKFDLPTERDSVMNFFREDNEQPLPMKISSVVKCIFSVDTEDFIILKWLIEFKENIRFFDQRAESIVFALMKLNWYAKDEKFISAYQGLILDLVTDNPIYLPNVLRMITDHFLTISSDKENYTDEEAKAILHIHDLAREIMRLVPLSREKFSSLLVERFPYIKRPAPVILHYIENMLTVSSYLVNEKSFFLTNIIEKLIQIDALCSKEDVLLAESAKSMEMEMEVDLELDSDSKSLDMAFPSAQTLDLSMNCMFAFIKRSCFPQGDRLNWEDTKKLYKELLAIFDKLVLPTHGNCHVQYLMFYICSLKQELCDGFLDYLWKKVQNFSVTSGLRQMAAFYIGSFLSRAQYISISTVVACFDLMCSWIHNYIDAHTAQELDVHGTFHSVCQTIFYVFAFRSKELIEIKDGYKYLRSLNFDRMVTCRLNPLRFVEKNIVQNFASICRNHQIAYVYPIIEKNNRSLLYTSQGVISEDRAAGAMISTFFPFDPYFLKRSKIWIEPMYRIYCHTPKEAEITVEDEEMSTCDELFSYSMSPGFKKTLPIRRTC